LTQPAAVTSSAHLRSSELVSPASNGNRRRTSARQEEAWFETPPANIGPRVLGSLVEDRLDGCPVGEGGAGSLRAEVERAPLGEAPGRDLDQAVAPTPRDLDRSVRRAGVDDDDLHRNRLPAQRREHALDPPGLVLRARDDACPWLRRSPESG
jgi:hypothetical protein